MTNEVIRDGEVFHKAVADVYDFSQQGKCIRGLPLINLGLLVFLVKY